MQPQRGDTVMFNYLPAHLPEKELCARDIVRRVIRQRKVGVVKVWNGLVTGDLDSRYDCIEVPLEAMTIVKRAKRKAKR